MFNMSQLCRCNKLIYAIPFSIKFSHASYFDNVRESVKLKMFDAAEYVGIEIIKSKEIKI